MHVKLPMTTPLLFALSSPLQGTLPSLSNMITLCARQVGKSFKIFLCSNHRHVEELDD